MLVPLLLFYRMDQPSCSNQTWGGASISQNTELRDGLGRSLEVCFCCPAATPQGAFLVGQDEEDLRLEGLKNFEDEKAGLDGDGSVG